MKPSDHDSYIEAAPEYARPILVRLRGLFHQACPEIEETIKWGQPHFSYQGIVGSMAAFKSYVSLGFFKGTLLADPLGILEPIGKRSGMAAARFSDAGSLPSDEDLLAYIGKALELNRQGVSRPRVKPEARPELPTPAALREALEENPSAKQTFDAFSPSHRREYIEWITEAKRETTRDKRIAQTIAWLTEGKQRNWKYTKTRATSQSRPGTTQSSSRRPPTLSNSLVLWVTRISPKRSRMPSDHLVVGTDRFSDFLQFVSHPTPLETGVLIKGQYRQSRGKSLDDIEIVPRLC